jgi:hypothetical protein
MSAYNKPAGKGEDKAIIFLSAGGLNLDRNPTLAM